MEPVQAPATVGPIFRSALSALDANAQNKKKKSRMSLGRRVSFAAQTKVRVFDKENPDSSVGPDRMRPLIKNVVASPDTPDSALMSATDEANALQMAFPSPVTVGPPTIPTTTTHTFDGVTGEQVDDDEMDEDEIEEEQQKGLLQQLPALTSLVSPGDSLKTPESEKKKKQQLADNPFGILEDEDSDDSLTFEQLSTKLNMSRPSLAPGFKPQGILKQRSSLVPTSFTSFQPPSLSSSSASASASLSASIETRAGKTTSFADMMFVSAPATPATPATPAAPTLSMVVSSTPAAAAFSTPATPATPSFVSMEFTQMVESGPRTPASVLKSNMASMEFTQMLESSLQPIPQTPATPSAVGMELTQMLSVPATPSTPGGAVDMEFTRIVSVPATPATPGAADMEFTQMVPSFVSKPPSTPGVVNMEFTQMVPSFVSAPQTPKSPANSHQSTMSMESTPLSSLGKRQSFDDDMEFTQMVKASTPMPMPMPMPVSAPMTPATLSPSKRQRMVDDSMILTPNTPHASIAAATYASSRRASMASNFAGFDADDTSMELTPIKDGGEYDLPTLPAVLYTPAPVAAKEVVHDMPIPAATNLEDDLPTLPVLSFTPAAEPTPVRAFSTDDLPTLPAITLTPVAPTHAPLAPVTDENEKLEEEEEEEEADMDLTSSNMGSLVQESTAAASSMAQLLDISFTAETFDFVKEIPEPATPAASEQLSLAPGSPTKDNKENTDPSPATAAVATPVHSSINLSSVSPLGERSDFHLAKEVDEDDSMDVDFVAPAVQVEQQVQAQAQAPVAATISLTAFLQTAGINFWDTGNSRSRESLAPVHQAVVLNTLDDFAIETCITKPQRDMFKYGCEELGVVGEESREAIAELENAINLYPPQIFLAATDADEAYANAAMQRVRNARSLARLHARQAWYMWRSKLTSSYLSDLENASANMARDQEYLDKFGSSLNEMEAVLLNKQNELLQRRANVEARKKAADEKTQQLKELQVQSDQALKDHVEDIEARKQQLQQQSQANYEAAIEVARQKAAQAIIKVTPADVHSAKASLCKAYASVSWRINEVSNNRIAILFDGLVSAEMVRNGSSGNLANLIVSPITSSQPSGDSADVLHLLGGLASLSKANVEFSLGTISQALKTIDQTYQNLVGLEKEVSVMGKFFETNCTVSSLAKVPEAMVVVRVANGIHGAVTIRFRFSCSEGSLVEYPSGTLSVTMQKHFGLVSEQQLAAAACRVTEGQNRLMRICDTVHRLLKATSASL